MSESSFDTIFFNAKVVTLDPAVRDAALVAVKGDRIALVSGMESLEELKRNAVRVVDCSGKTLLPGFVDAHCHVAAYAESLVSLSLSPRDGIRSISDIKDRIREACVQASPGEWVRGKGYNEFYLDENRHPNRRDLDPVAPSNPVKLTHRSGHAHVLNSLALQKVGIDAATGDPPGGMIERELKTGQPTGLLFGMGGYLSDRIPGFDEAEIERGLELANEKMLSCGITSVQDASSSNNSKQWKRYESWKRRGLFAPRLTMMLGLRAFSDFDEKTYTSNLPDTDLRLGAVKIIVDRVTGSLEPSRGKLNEIIASVHAAGFQAAIHAVEEPVVEAAVKGIAVALRRHPRRDARHRIEHCSVCRPDLLQHLAGLGGVVVTQPAFLHYEGDRYLKTVPAEELENLYPVGSMLESKLRTGFGSDFPIVDPNPWVGIGAAVTRKTEDGRRVPGRGTDLFQALRMQTLEAAAATFEENLKGSISPGKMADFVLLNEDPFSVSPDRIKDIQVRMTVLGGSIMYTDG
ncbi:MAG: amidohydrolase [Acidobacteria bacterium]|nr:amidohydrolase [Acidobacteriota bacterium]